MVENTVALQEEMSRLDSIISGKYLGDNSLIPKEQMHVAYMWLENDISSSFCKTDDMLRTREEIEELLKSSWAYDKICKTISIDKAYRRAEIRKDFAFALRSVKNGSALSEILGWSFSDEDLTNLAKLHASNRFREKIEELLTDCNFHYECGLMSSKDYSKWL